MINGFISTTGNLSALAETVQASQSSYKNGVFQTGAFLENHDQPRLPSQTQDQSVSRSVDGSFHIVDALELACSERHDLAIRR